jgi:hypothetical protein
MSAADSLPRALPGHWDTDAGHDIATQYAKTKRADLMRPQVSDLVLANEIFMTDRNDPALIVYQQAAKDRIRWLSVQLAIAQHWRPIAEAPLKGEFLVKGPSGYGTHKSFVTLAYRDPEYRGDAWLMPGGDRLSEMGWFPTHFLPSFSVEAAR